MRKKNILVLTGSARKGGNSDRLADAFIKGANSVGHQVVKYNTASKNMKPCIDCKACFRNDIPCLFDKDFNELSTYLDTSDVIVFATPLYAYSFPAALKLAIDKFNTYLVGEKEINIKESILLVTAGEDNKEVFAGIVSTYNSIVRIANWSNRGIITVNGLMDKKSILKTDALKEAEKLGQSIRR
ncbi:flavodoxin family protein [Dysgonomonas sp. ZJ709]|uniref:flavodoxin family protein n=1 Tax=Dysgonomonas sp. ZJ709 TaxID=2709797 RepID=UPI0013EA3337|nr:flavodoxin family protein [Dysgonomonas sp. ZJ709]